MDKENDVVVDLAKIQPTGINTQKSYKYETPPEPNWRFYFGDSIKNNIHYNVYLENPPNRFQRWLCYKAFRLTWEQIK